MDDGCLAVMTIRSAFRVDGPFEHAGEPRSRLRRLEARGRQGEGGGGWGRRYLFGGRLSRVRYRSKAGDIYRVAADCPVPIVVLAFLVKRRERTGRELDGIGRVIRQRLRRRCQVKERQHVEGWLKGACSSPRRRETMLCGWSGTGVCRQWGRESRKDVTQGMGQASSGRRRPPE